MLNFVTTTHDANVIEQTATSGDDTATVAVYPVVSPLGQTSAYDVIVRVNGEKVQEWRAPKTAVVPALQYAGQAIAAKSIQ